MPNSRQGSLLLPAHFVQLRHRGLHLNGGEDRILVVIGIVLRTSKHCENRVSDVFVNGSTVRKDHRHRHREIVIQHPDHIIGIHFARRISKTANIRVQDRHLAAFATQPKTTFMGKQPFGHLGGELPQQIGLRGRFLAEHGLQLVVGDRHGGVLRDHNQQDAGRSR